MIVNVICDSCREAVADKVVYETKWKQVAMCATCHDDVDHEVIYDCKTLVTDVKAALVSLVETNPEATTAQLVAWFMKNAVVAVFMTPFDSVVKDALRDRSVFHPVKVEGRGNALSYEVVRGGADRDG